MVAGKAVIANAVKQSQPAPHRPSHLAEERFPLAIASSLRFLAMTVLE
jgi:hypothetical protein